MGPEGAEGNRAKGDFNREKGTPTLGIFTAVQDDTTPVNKQQTIVRGESEIV